LAEIAALGDAIRPRATIASATMLKAGVVAGMPEHELVGLINRDRVVLDVYPLGPFDDDP
jgi:hypothetical protein